VAKQIARHYETTSLRGRQGGLFQKIGHNRSDKGSNPCDCRVVRQPAAPDHHTWKRFDRNRHRLRDEPEALLRANYGKGGKRRVQVGRCQQRAWLGELCRIAQDSRHLDPTRIAIGRAQVQYTLEVVLDGT
jgi:hypothetical protein